MDYNASDLVKCRIPIESNEKDTTFYREINVDNNHILFNEKLVDLSKAGIVGENYYSKNNNPPYKKALRGSLTKNWARLTVAKKLRDINSKLKKLNLELFVWDAYRTIECQLELWNFFLERNSKIEPSKDKVTQTLKYVSDPSSFDPTNPETWPTHSTGASIDLTLRDIKSGEPLEMGSNFDEMTPKSKTSYYEKLLDEKKIDGDNIYLLNRRILYWIMRSEGFVNYPEEYWHFDWGNQMYISNKNEPHTHKHAWYGYYKPKEF